MKGELTQLSDTRWQYKAGLRTYYIKRERAVPDEGEGVHEYRISWVEKGDEHSELDVWVNIENVVGSIDAGYCVKCQTPTVSTRPRSRKSACPGCGVNPCICVPSSYYVPPSGQQSPSPPPQITLPASGQPGFNPNVIRCSGCGSISGGGCKLCRKIAIYFDALCPGCLQTQCCCIPQPAAAPQQSSP